MKSHTFMLHADTKSIVLFALPNGQLKGNEWVALNPTRNDRNLGSFRINLQTGKWADFATGDTGGDVIGLVAYLYKISRFKAVIKIKREFPGGLK